MNSARKLMAPADRNDEQRRRVRRTTILLVLVALGIYVAFIASSVMKAQP
ncbi:MAG: hypothetical protein ACR2I8_07540 [Steroidobacteraceae bacterium]